MAVQDVVQQILGIMLTYLELAVVITLLYMVIMLFVGENSPGAKAWDSFKNRKGKDNSTPNNQERTNRQDGTTGNNPNTTPVDNTIPENDTDNVEHRELPPGEADFSRRAKLRFMAINMNNEPIENVRIEVKAKPAGNWFRHKKIGRDGVTNVSGYYPTALGKDKINYLNAPVGTLSYTYNLRPQQWQTERALPMQASVFNAFRLRNWNPAFWFQLWQRDNAGKGGAWWSAVTGVFRESPWAGKGIITIDEDEEKTEPIVLAFYSNKLPPNFSPKFKKNDRVERNGKDHIDLIGVVE